MKEIINALYEITYLVDDIISECVDSDSKSSMYYKLYRIKDCINAAERKLEEMND